MVTVTYGRSAITKGVDMPQVTLCIIDVNQFLPQIAIPNISISMSGEELRGAGIDHVRDSLIQTIGRVLRSLKKRIAGVTQVDEKQIVLFPHGLPKELMDFKLDPRMLNEYREYRETFVSTIPQYVVESICDAIVTCKAGGAPANRREIDRQIAKDKALEKGIETLSHAERSLLTEEDKVELKASDKAKRKGGHQEIRQNDLKQRIIEAAQEGVSWRETSKRYNLNRLSKKEQGEFREIFGQFTDK
jgi:hypothetical protein